MTEPITSAPTSAAPSTIGPVRLELPPLSMMSRVARLTAAGVASMAGFSIEELDDINVMVSEVMVALVEHGAQSTIAVTFEVIDDCFTVRGATDLVDFDLDHPDLALCRTVLEAVSTRHGEPDERWLEQALVTFARTGDQQLRDEIVERSLWLAKRSARRFADRGEPFDDVLQVASVALLHAIDRFDPSVGVPFGAYATPTIVGEIKRHFRDRTWRVHVPRRAKDVRSARKTWSCRPSKRTPPIARRRSTSPPNGALAAIAARPGWRRCSTAKWFDRSSSGYDLASARSSRCASSTR